MTATSKSKQEQILQGAMRVFLAHGYAGTSMDRVVAEAGVSKPTLYSYFQNKEGLFRALIERVTISRAPIQSTLGLFEGEPALVLSQLATSLLTKMEDREYISLLRLVYSESGRFPELAKLYIQGVIEPIVNQLRVYFESHPELNIQDPSATAQVFLGAIVAFMLTQKGMYAEETTMRLEKERLLNSLLSLILQSHLSS